MPGAGTGRLGDPAQPRRLGSAHGTAEPTYRFQVLLRLRPGPAAGEYPGDGGARVGLERRLRLVDGLDVGLLTPAGIAVAREAAGDGLLQTIELGSGRAVLTRRGRLLADGIALRMID